MTVGDSISSTPDSSRRSVCQISDFFAWVPAGCFDSKFQSFLGLFVFSDSISCVNNSEQYAGANPLRGWLSSTVRQKNKKTSQQKAELLKLKELVINGMTSYMKFGAAESKDDPDYDHTFDAGYSQKHIDKCAKILDAYLDDMDRIAGTAQDERILASAKKAVLSLNALNEKCDGGLIETDQREQICELFIQAAKHAGLVHEGDFTEEWREW
ncbi:MAG: hypothetical protein QM627_12395 [Luteolibacter sp.]